MTVQDMLRREINEVGKFRFCPACGRTVIRKWMSYDLDEQDIDDINLKEIRCSCCNRPWGACPCTPVTDGECGSFLVGERRNLEAGKQCLNI